MHLAERDLELALVLRDLALHLDVRAGGAGGERVGEVVPHAGFKLAGLVGERERQILAVRLAVARGDVRQQEEAGNGLVLNARRVGDVEVFHRGRA